jgi:membrane protein DedA with SNARE-associated domain
MELGVIVLLLEQYRYLILFPLACFEGPILGFISGTLIPLGYFSWIPLIITLVLADVLPDMAYYLFGRWGKRTSLIEKVGPRLKIIPERFEAVGLLWHTHTFKTMAVTKFAYGLSTPLLITAGLVNVPFRLFWMYSATLAFFQYSLLVSLGYFFGGYFATVQDILVRIQLLVAVAIVVFVLYYIITRSVRSKFLTTGSSQ